MKDKLMLAVVLVSASFPVLGGADPTDSAAPLPEPSTLGLFAAAAIAVTVLAKLKK